MTAALVLLVFAACATMMYLRWMPAIAAIPLMAVAMSLAAGVAPSSLDGIVTHGAVQLAPVYVAVLFGALLGRTTLETGIARSIVNLAAEYGGENPLVLALVLCAIVALLFTSLSGLGAIIMVGSIVLPIMMTTGVPRTIAATLFLMAFALGYIFNIANWTFYTKYFGVDQSHLIRYAIVLAVIDALALTAYAVASFRRDREYATWAVRAESGEESEHRVPAIALVTPLLPLASYYVLHVDAAPAFLLAAVFGAVVTRPARAVQTLVAAAIRGVEDAAPAVLLFMGIGMLLVATKQPQVTAAIAPLVGGDWIRNPLAYVAVFGLASPLALYRGPLNPFGVGIAVFTVLLTEHSIDPVLLIAAIMAVVQVQNVCDPTNTANVWVANFTGVPIVTITKRTLAYQTGVAVAATLCVVLAAKALFGLNPFVGLIAPASAAPVVAPGMYARATAADRVAVDSDGAPLARAAAAATIRALHPPLHAFAYHGDPDAADCSGKPYAAYVYVDASQFKLAEGIDFDVGLRLEDCGGWIVDEWHDRALLSSVPTAAAARKLAIEGVDRLQAWALAHPSRSGSLFERGVATHPGARPTFFYALFKTVDGYMRAYVRAGGPAYDAGMRTNDVVDDIDGRAWWTYGTYQAQARAYDGRAHTFELTRAGRTLNVRLGEPFPP